MPEELILYQFGAVNASTSWEDGYASGILGLGYPEISQIPPINDTKETALDLLEDRKLYPTVLTRLAKQGIQPYFSMALERTPLAQELGFGELPHVYVTSCSIAHQMQAAI